MYVRDEIEAFARLMEKEMAKNDEKKGDSWKSVPVGDLSRRLIYNWEKLLETPFPSEYERKALLDLANMCMMMYHRSAGETAFRRAKDAGLV